MQVLRQIVEVKNHTFKIVLPDNFESNKVEVIVLPIDEPVSVTKIKNSERFLGAISTKTAENMHKHLSEIRNNYLCSVLYL